MWVEFPKDHSQDFFRTPVGWELLSQQFRPGWSCLDLAAYSLQLLESSTQRLPQAVRWCPKLRVRDAPDHGIIRWVTLNPGCRWLRMVKGNLFWMKMEKNGEVLRLAVSKHAWKRGQNCKCMGCCFLKLGLKETGSIYLEILVFALGKTMAECHPCWGTIWEVFCVKHSSWPLFATRVQGLFTLDNRRLYVLQRAAVYHYPRRGWDDLLRQLNIAERLAGDVRSTSKSSLIAGRFFIICAPGLLGTWWDARTWRNLYNLCEGYSIISYIWLSSVISGV